MDNENITNKLITQALRRRYKHLRSKNVDFQFSRIKLEKISRELDKFVTENFSEYNSIAPKLHGAEDGIIVEDANRVRHYVKVSEELDKIGYISRINGQIYCSIMGDEIAVQPNVFLSGNLSLSSSVEVSSKCCSLTEYLPECKVYTGEVDENIVLPNNLLEIVAFTTCLGLKDIRGDNIVVDNSGEEPRAVLVDFLNPENRTSAIEIDKILNTFKKFKNANRDDISLPFSVGNKTIRFFQTGNSYAKNMVELFYLLQSSDNSGKFIPSPSPVMELNFPFRRCMDKFLSEPNADIKMQSAFIESGTKMISRYNEIKAILSDPSISLDLRNRSIKEKKFLESGLVMLFKIDQISREYFRKQTIGGDLRREIILSLKPNIKINTLDDEEEEKILNDIYRPTVFALKTYGYNSPLNSPTSKYRSAVGRRYSRLLSSPVNPSALVKRRVVKPVPSQPHETFMYFS